MAFSNKIRHLPGCNTYVGALNIHTQAAVPRNKENWPDGTRPLDTPRMQHYAVRREGDTIFFRLYSTDVVVWHGPTSVTLDSSHDSVMTRAFADNFLPNGIGLCAFREEGYVVKLQGHSRDDFKLFLRGVHTFERDGLLWNVVSPTIKPRRQVVDPDRAKQINTEMKPFVEWVKGIWAISGNDGHHPWVGRLQSGSMARSSLYDFATSDDPDDWEVGVRKVLPTCWDKPGMVYKPVAVDTVLAAIRTAVYKGCDVYIKVDYDQPAPRLTK